MLYILAGSAIAIGSLIGLNAWMGGWTPSRIDSIDAVIKRLVDDNVVFDAGDCVLATDHQSALVMSTNGSQIGLVVARGDILISRLLDAATIKSAQCDDAGNLIIALRDLTMAKARINLGDAARANDWARKLNELGA